LDSNGRLAAIVLIINRAAGWCSVPMMGTLRLARPTMINSCTGCVGWAKERSDAPNIRAAIVLIINRAAGWCSVSMMGTLRFAHPAMVNSCVGWAKERSIHDGHAALCPPCDD
jgi:hypothetical protein